VVGLDRFRPEDRPPVEIPFAAYHVMISLGMFFLALTSYASWKLWRGRLFRRRWLLWVFVYSVLGALAANQAGWVAAEVGRQPWIVHPPVQWNGQDLVVGPAGFVEYDETQGLRTTEAVSRAISAEQVLGSLIMFSLIYILLGVVWVWVLNGKIRKGPEAPEELEQRRRKRQSLLAVSSRGGSLTGGESGPEQVPR
jgi:cytochrome d ubiquinol oxidase subunit I